MTRTQYQSLRSHARDKWRTAEIFDEQAYVGPTGGMRSADIAHSQRLTKNAQYAESLVPGGLTRPYRYHGTCLLAEWQERRQRVYSAIAARHRAARTFPTATRNGTGDPSPADTGARGAYFEEIA